jgi:hypothetical protein
VVVVDLCGGFDGVGAQDSAGVLDQASFEGYGRGQEEGVAQDNRVEAALVGTGQ